MAIFRQAADRARVTGDMLVVANAFFRQGQMWESLFDVRRAQQAYDEGAALAEQLNDPVLQSKGLRLRANLLSAPAQAHPMLIQAVALGEGDPATYAAALSSLAKCEVRQNNVEGAIVLYRRSVVVNPENAV